MCGCSPAPACEQQRGAVRSLAQRSDPRQAPAGDDTRVAFGKRYGSHAHRARALSTQGATCAVGTPTRLDRRNAIDELSRARGHAAGRCRTPRCRRRARTRTPTRDEPTASTAPALQARSARIRGPARRGRDRDVLCHGLLLGQPRGWRRFVGMAGAHAGWNRRRDELGLQVGTFEDGLTLAPCAPQRPRPSEPRPRATPASHVRDKGGRL